MARRSTFIATVLRAAVRQIAQDAAEFGLAECARVVAQLGGVDEAHAEGDLLRAADLEALALLDGLHEGRRLQQAVGRAGIEPGAAAAEPFDVQRAVLQIDAVEIGDLQLAARRRLQPRGESLTSRVVEIEAGHRPVGFRRRRLLLDRRARGRRRRTRPRRSAPGRAR